MADKINQLAAIMGFVSTKDVAMPGDEILTEILETFDKLKNTPEFKNIARRRKTGELTKEQAWAEYAALTKTANK